MAIGFSDGTSYEDMHDYYLGQPHSKQQAPDRTAQDDEADPFHNKIQGKDQSRMPVGSPQKPAGELFDTQAPQLPSQEFKQPIRPVGSFSSLEPTEDPQDQEAQTSRSLRHFKQDTVGQVDTSHNVPLIASALTKDGINMYGLAVDHRVNLAMNFEGKDHDITPFLWAHENAELPAMAGAVKGGTDARSAYELAHDKVANPAEAAVRNAYAIQNGLDVDKFNAAYWSHIDTAKKAAAEESDKPRHPDAHTTRYALDPTGKPANDNTPVLQFPHPPFKPATDQLREWFKPT